MDARSTRHLKIAAPTSRHGAIFLGALFTLLVASACKNETPSSTRESAEAAAIDSTSASEAGAPLVHSIEPPLAMNAPAAASQDGGDPYTGIEEQFSSVTAASNSEERWGADKGSATDERPTFGEPVRQIYEAPESAGMIPIALGEGTPTASINANPNSVENLGLGWNADVHERTCKENCGKLPSVRVSHSYRLRLSVVTGAARATISPRILTELAKSATESASLVLIPIFADGATAIPGSSSVEFPIEIQRLSEIAPTMAPTWGEQSIPFLVTSNARGCIRIVVSVWNEEKTTALDAIAVAIPVAGSRETANCDLSNTKSPSGIEIISMADVVDVYGGAPTVNTDNRVAIHAFQIGKSDAASFVVAVLRENDKSLVSGWRLQSSITSAFGTGSNFQSSVEHDRAKLATNTRADQGKLQILGPLYGEASTYIKKKLFSATSKHDIPGLTADQTFIEIKRMIETSNQTLVSAQFFILGADGSDRLFLPLEILGAPSSPVFNRQFELVTPLSISSPPKQTSCIRNWNVIAAQSVGADVEKIGKPYDQTYSSIVDREPTRWRARTITSKAGAQQLFEAADASSAEGLIILSHYGRQSLKIENNEPALEVEDLLREFAPGSVAFIAACNTAAPEEAKALISKLHSKNIGTIVASPLSVPVPYATVLTNSLLDVLDDAYRAGDERTMRELYTAATKHATDYYQQINNYGDGFMHFEYLLIGNENAQLCPPRPGPRQ